MFTTNVRFSAFFCFFFSLACCLPCINWYKLYISRNSNIERKAGKTFISKGYNLKVLKCFNNNQERICLRSFMIMFKYWNKCRNFCVFRNCRNCFVNILWIYTVYDCIRHIHNYKYNVHHTAASTDTNTNTHILCNMNLELDTNCNKNRTRFHINKMQLNAYKRDCSLECMCGCVVTVPTPSTLKLKSLTSSTNFRYAIIVPFFLLT